MGFLTSLTKAITDFVRVSAQVSDIVDPLSMSVNLLKNRGQPFKKGVLQSGFEEGERYARANPKITVPVMTAAGGIAGGVLGGGWGAVPGAMIGREIGGYYAGEPERSRIKGSLVAGGTTAVTLGAAQGAGSMMSPTASQASQTGVRMGAGSLTAGATTAGTQYAQTGKINPQDVGIAMAGSALTQGIGAGVRYYASPDYMPLTMPDSGYDPSYTAAAKDATMYGKFAQQATGAGINYGYGQWKQAQAQKETEQEFENYLESLRQQDIQAAEQTETSVYNPYKKNKIDEMLQNQGNKFPYSGYQQYRSI